MDSVKINEKFTVLMNQYNCGKVKGIDLPNVPDKGQYSNSTVCANIAWCLLDKARFWEYYNKSEYWRVQLVTACRQFGVKNYKPIFIGSQKVINSLLSRVYDYLSKEIGESVYMQPHTLNNDLSMNTILSILYNVECDLLYDSP